MKLDIGSEKIMLVFILGLLFFTVIQPTFYPFSSTTSPPPAGGPTPTPGGVGTTPTPTPPPPPPPPAGGQNPAFLTITPSTSTIKKGETLALSLTLNTGDFEIDSVDLILNFDFQFLQANSIEPGTIFSQYPVQKIEDNKITISAAGKIIGGAVVGFKGTGEYTRVIFQALKTVNSTQVTFNSNSMTASAGVNRLDLAKCQPGNYQITD